MNNFQPAFSPYYGYQDYQRYMPDPRQTMQNPQNTASIEFVDSINVVNSRNADMSGRPQFYCNVNGTEIYRKQLFDNGNCPTLVYKLVNDESVHQDRPMSSEEMKSLLESFKTEIISTVQSMVPAVKQTKGGANA